MFDKKTIVLTALSMKRRHNEIADALEWIDSQEAAADLVVESAILSTTLGAIRVNNPAAMEEADMLFEHIAHPLPEPKANLTHPFDLQAIPSDDVLVKVERFEGWTIGRYFHGIGEWQINGFHGQFKVTEWQPIGDAGFKLEG